ncbi:Sensor protein kinase walK [uncultured Clostridium sp.]|nr:Sensor protein kinase walK [uncultured Clostridium sp.]
MTKRIFRSIFSVSAVILVISIGLILGLLYGHFGKRLEKELKQEAAYLALAVEKDGEESLAKLSKTGERVTLIDSDGTVLYDNKTDSAAMENHQDRSEVQEAEKLGEGYASRTSATLGKKTIYYALRLENGQILRVSSTQYTVAGILGGMIQPILVMIFLMLILSLAAAFHLSQKIVEPLNSLNLDDPKMNDTYDEITPLLSRINKQQKTIRQQLSNAKRQQEEFAIITNNMSEGLLVIDKQTELLSCNTSAVKLLGAKKAVTDQSVLTMNRSEPFRKAVEGVLKGKHMVETMELQDGVRQLLANPVMEDGKVTGGVLLLVDVTEKTQREALRREFTANVSHELRTPLTSISGFAEIMQDGYVKPEDVKRVAGKIYDEAQRLIVLVGDIMEISRLDEGVTEYKKEQTDLLDVIEECKERLQESADRKEIKIEVEGSPLVFETTKTILEEVVYNLMDNAIKYNREQGNVTVRIFRKEKQFGFSVKDTGIGIPLIHQDRIFERFYRVDKSRSKEIGGTGLGLSIVKHGVSCLGAQISVDSIPDEGSTFTVTWG